ncbi:hypothetical protein [Stenotrophomonas sp. AB1(2024)]|uniref:hypothetical protein n=1 Tax=Stenotrophomonas sp. AB1(2024) TaxID=3132215 RepID=UPI0030A5F403
MDIAADMDEQPGEAVETEELDEEQAPEEVEEEAEEEASEEESEEEEETPPEDPEFEVEGAKVKLSELRAGYMKDADYRRKTSEVAETKRAVEGERHEVQQQREYLAKQTAPLLGLLREQLIGSQQRLAQLANEDPAAWVSENQQFQQRAQMFDALLAENDRLAGQQKADQERQEAELAKSERVVLHEKLKEWNDPKVAAAEQQQIAQYLIDLGYSQDELNMLTDHRALLAVRDAAKWREHQKTVASAKAKKGQPAPPERVVKAGAAKVPPTQQQRRIAEASKRLNNNPNDLRSLAALAREGGF